MEEIHDTKLFKVHNSGVSIVDVNNMQKVDLNKRELSTLFLKSLKKDDTKIEGLSFDDMAYIENKLFNYRVEVVEKGMKGDAWRVTLTSQGEDYTRKSKEELTTCVELYRMLFPDRTHNEIKLEDCNKRVIVDSQYNIQVIDDNL